MSSGDTKTLIKQAVEHLQDELPALRQLKLVIRLELRARGDVPIWRVEVPGPKIDKDPAGDARIDVSVSRSHFNELAAEGRLKHWVDAYEHGHVRVSGDPAVTKLIGNVIQRQLARTAEPCRPASVSCVLACAFPMEACAWRVSRFAREAGKPRLAEAPAAVGRRRRVERSELAHSAGAAGGRVGPPRGPGSERSSARFKAERDARRRLAETLKRERRAAEALHERAERAEPRVPPPRRSSSACGRR